MDGVARNRYSRAYCRLCFDAAVVATGRGLGHMQQRAARLGGTLTWDSGPGGTVLRLLLPATGAAPTR